MKIKKTIYTEYDERGRVTRQSRTVECVRDSYTDYDYDLDTRHGVGNTPHSSFKSIYEAYHDLCVSRQW